MAVTNALNINNDGLPVFDESTGQFSATALTTKADLLGYTGSAYQRFPVGTDTHILKADSSQDVGWRWACADFEFIASQSASSSASIDFTDFADSECFNAYKLVWINVERTATSDTPQIRFSINNGSSWLSSGYKWIRETTRDNLTHNVTSSASASSIQIATYTGPSRLSWRQGEFFFYTSSDPSGTLCQGCMWSNVVLTADEAAFGSSRGFAINTTSSQVNGIQYFINSGPITAGDFYLYGMIL